MIMLCVLVNASNCIPFCLPVSIIKVGNLNLGSSIWGMNHLVVADIDAHMMNTTSGSITAEQDYITSLDIPF